MTPLKQLAVDIDFLLQCAAVLIERPVRNTESAVEALESAMARVRKSKAALWAACLDEGPCGP